MNTTIKQVEELSGEIKIPGSKSYTHRILAAASLGTKTIIENPSHSDANVAMKKACEVFGAKISGTNNWEVIGFEDRYPRTTDKIDVGNSGTALRLSIALSTLTKGGSIILDGDQSLRRRLNEPLVAALTSLGADIDSAMPGMRAPVTVRGHGLKGGSITLSGEVSSQYLTSLLIASPLAENDVDISITGKMVSKPYIDMTLHILEQFGINVIADPYKHYHVKAGQEYVSPAVCKVPGDYSQAAFPLAAGCLTESDITVTGLDKHDDQGDRIIIDYLKQMGADIDDSAVDRVRIRGPAKLDAIDADLMDTPDLFPVMSVLGIFAKGSTRLYNMPQIRLKETDRIAVIEREFKKLGVDTDVKDDEITIHGKNLDFKDYLLEAHGDNHGVTDHRIAMALSLIGLKTKSVTIKESQKVSISYPNYFEDMKSIGFKALKDAPYLEL